LTVSRSRVEDPTAVAQRRRSTGTRTPRTRTFTTAKRATKTAAGIIQTRTFAIIHI